LEERGPEPILDDRFVDAIAYAVELHAPQARKGTSIPYLTHLLAVCSLVLEDDGTEDEAIAALLHDGPEDQGGEPVLAEIRIRFGDEVAAMVEGLSDSLAAKDEPKEDWRPRKERYLRRLVEESESVVRISLADKLHNARSMSVDLAVMGGSLWERFNVPYDAQAWYFHKLLAIFRQRAPASRNLPEFERVVHDLFGES
jgi:(p)ppGpp synthase/HD superfamily hydrolase